MITIRGQIKLGYRNSVSRAWKDFLKSFKNPNGILKALPTPVA